MTADEKFNQQLGQQAKQAEMQMALQAEADQGGPTGQPEQTDAPGEPLEAKAGPLRGDQIRAALLQATEDELQVLEPLVIKAKQSGNGEWSKVQVMVKRIADRNRITF